MSSSIPFPAPSYRRPALRLVKPGEKPDVPFRRRRETIRTVRDRILSDPQYLLHIR
jgi:hypothetical protein